MQESNTNNEAYTQANREQSSIEGQASRTRTDPEVDMQKSHNPDPDPDPDPIPGDESEPDANPDPAPDQPTEEQMKSRLPIANDLPDLADLVRPESAPVHHKN